MCPPWSLCSLDISCNLRTYMCVCVCTHVCVHVYASLCIVIELFHSLPWEHVTVSASVGTYWDIFHHMGSFYNYFLTKITSRSKYVLCTSVLCCSIYKLFLLRLDQCITMLAQFKNLFQAFIPAY